MLEVIRSRVRLNVFNASSFACSDLLENYEEIKRAQLVEKVHGEFLRKGVSQDVPTLAFKIAQEDWQPVILCKYTGPEPTPPKKPVEDRLSQFLRRLRRELGIETAKGKFQEIGKSFRRNYSTTRSC